MPLPRSGSRVAARTSAFAFKGKAEDISEIGARLHVSNVLEGSVRVPATGSASRCSSSMSENGFHLWSERYDREMGDVFDVQDEIAQALPSAAGESERRRAVGGEPPHTSVTSKDVTTGIRDRRQAVDWPFSASRRPSSSTLRVRRAWPLRGSADCYVILASYAWVCRRSPAASLCCVTQLAVALAPSLVGS